MKDAVQWVKDGFYVGKAFVQYMLPIKLQEFKMRVVHILKKVVGRA